MISENRLKKILRGQPSLCTTGFDANGPAPGEDFLHQVSAALQWLSSDPFRSKLVERRGSYALKHIIERDIGTYISNGATIAAAALSGFEVVRASTGPNCRFRRPI